MSIVGGVVGVGVALLLLPGGSRIRTSLSVLAVGVVVVLLGLGLGGKQLRTRINTIFNPTAAHVSTRAGDVARQHIWKAAIKTGEANLITGVGFGKITTYLPRYGAPVAGTAHAHDTYLQFFAEGGVLGLIALLGVVSASLRDLLRAFRSHRVWVAGATGGLAATLIAWSTDVEVRYVQVSALVAVVIGLIAALSATAGGYGETKAPAS
jgi:O-antigen ligase